MTEIKITMLVAMSCVFVVNMANIPWKLRLRFKPFNCEMCLAFWICFICLLTSTDVLTAIIYAGASAYLTSPLKKLI